MMGSVTCLSTVTGTLHIDTETACIVYIIAAVT